MAVRLNPSQTDKLSNFFFDIAKGLTLGMLGLSVTSSGVSLFIRFTNIFISAFMIYSCLRAGLFLSKEL